MKDNELIKKVHSGNKEAVGMIVERYYADIYRFCFYMVQTEEDAYDITQETFLKFMRYGTSYKHRNLKGYLLTIARNICFNYFRDEKEKAVAVECEKIDSIPNQRNFLNEAEDAIYLRSLLKELSQDIREVVILHTYEEEKFKDVAKIMGCSVSTAKSRFRLGVNQLNSEIKKIFTKANEQVPVDKIRKQKTYHAMIEEMGKQKVPMISEKMILLHQVYYMDKLFFVFYGILICLGIMAVRAFQYTEMNQNEMIMVCMTGSGILSTTSISMIDKLFFGRMGELGECCYFNTKQCVAVWLVLSGVINMAMLLLMVGYLNYRWKAGVLQAVLYILTPYLLSNVVALGILSMETREKKLSLFGMSAVFLPISYGVIGSIPGVFLTTAFWMWVAAFLLAGLLLVIQAKKLLSKLEKGEILCMN